YYTFLLVGTNDNYNTDTIMLGSVDTDQDTVNIVSIPRDTMVDVDVNIKKINGAYGRDGMAELRKEVNEVTGVYPDYYCLVNMENFIDVVDVIGGVYFDVPYNMKHDDANSKYNINLSKGYQLLNGAKAIQLVRYRGTSASDYGRMEIQRDFLKAVGKKLVAEFSIDQASDLISVMSKSIKTNMPIKDMIWFYINVARTINFDTDITFDTMPGTTTGKYNRQDYVYLDLQSTLDYINEKINPYTTDISKDALNIIHLQDK
ncbi:MAG: LCP family protein, partial [Clostridiaceae bacterium]|nr:LCP family protein [Clostridiaceae bacterium]